MTRKFFLTRVPSAFLLFPGGFGTLDELFEVASLMQTLRIPKTPVLLHDRSFWEPLRSWLDELESRKLVSKPYLDCIQIFDTEAELLDALKSAPSLASSD